MSKKRTKLLKYDELPEGINIKSIVVGSEQAKEQLLLAIRYLHDLRNIDTDIAAVNELVHMYHVPGRITVADNDIWHDDVVISMAFSREQLRPLFEPDSWFMKKLQEGPFYGEFGYPTKHPDMTVDCWLSRRSRVEVSNICVAIKDIRINSRNQLVGKVKFIGSMKEYLETTLLEGKLILGARYFDEDQNEKDSKILYIAAFDVLGCE